MIGADQQQQQIEAAVDKAISDRDLSGALDLAPGIARCGLVSRALMMCKLRLAFRDAFPARQFRAAMNRADDAEVQGR